MKLLDYLKTYKITQEEFASKLGVTRPFVTRIANGKQNPPLRLAIKITEISEGKVTAADLYNPEINPVDKKKNKLK